MATEAANAERQARAQLTVDSHVERIARSLNLTAPPRTRADSRDSRNAAETERMATFLEMVADAVDPNAAAHKKGQTPQALGGIGDGYNHSEELAKAEQRSQGQRPGEPVDVEEADSPVSDKTADEAIEAIGRMRSQDRLQAIADGDERVTVKDAAKARLAELQ